MLIEDILVGLSPRIINEVLEGTIISFVKTGSQHFLN